MKFCFQKCSTDLLVKCHQIACAKLFSIADFKARLDEAGHHDGSFWLFLHWIPTTCVGSPSLVLMTQIELELLFLRLDSSTAGSATLVGP